MRFDMPVRPGGGPAARPVFKHAAWLLVAPPPSSSAAKNKHAPGSERTHD